MERVLAIGRDQWSGKGKYKVPALPETIELPRIPEGWVWARLDSVSQLKGGITVDRNRADRAARRVPYLRVANVQRGYLDLTEMKEINAAETDIAELRLHRGDILFTEGGDRDKLGRGWIWEDQVPECIHQNHVFRARPLLAELSSKLISWWGNSFGKDWFEREGKQTTNLASISLTKLSRFPIPIAPSCEQQRITCEVDRLFSVADEVLKATHANIDRSRQLKASVLSRAFQGFDSPDNADSMRTDGVLDMKSLALPQLPPPRESEADDFRVDLIAVLSDRSTGMTLEQLFIEAKYKGDQVDEFYQDLVYWN